MHYFKYRNGRLYCEAVSLSSLAQKYGTPLYIYSASTIKQNFWTIQNALKPLDLLICYAVKASSNIHILKLLASCGAGFDIVSGGELRRIQAAGCDTHKVVFAGVGKQAWEIEAALRANIYCFNVESESELKQIETCARKMRQPAPVALRVNPDVKAHTHAKITTGTYQNKFGIPYEQALAIYNRYNSRWLQWRGVQMHIGSQITKTTPFIQAVKRMLPLVKELKQRFGIEFFDIGGGIGIEYIHALESGDPQWWQSAQAHKMITANTYAEALLPLLKPLSLKIIIEPGRFIVGNAAVLLTKVIYRKQIGRKKFVIVDAAMNDLIRPMLYDAYHQIIPVIKPKTELKEIVDIVGPVCESGDCFAKDRPIPKIKEGELLCIMSAGAYGASMSSTYNSRPLVPEVLVEGRNVQLIRRRQTIDEMLALEL